MNQFKLARLTTDEVRAVCALPPTAVLVPVGSVEPHGPHLPLDTDSIISEEACARAVIQLRQQGIMAYIAPTVPYGVTEFAAGFAGAISVPADILSSFLESIAKRFLADGWSHVCFVNNHLEPAHDSAVRKAISSFPEAAASVACPLTKKWARTLSDEFKRGDCHAGRYESSLVLAAGEDVRSERAALPRLEVSLAQGIREGKSTFLAMGMNRAYTGAPGDATKEEGDALFERLSEMIVGEITARGLKS